MRPLSYARAASADEAARLCAERGHVLLGGGTNLIDLMRKGVEHPSHLVDVTHLSGAIAATPDGGLTIGAAARNSAVAAHPLVRAHYPMLSRALLSGASAQVRNMATVAGNLMQRTRCVYFADPAGSRCNKRAPGSGCDAIGGFHRYHAVLGGSQACIAAHPSDMCVALAALDARIHIRGAQGAREVPLVDFHRLPGDRPEIETVLEPGEVITALTLPPPAFAGRSAYRKVRDRASFAFALVSLAVGVRLEAGRIADLRIALGGIAPKPWRALRAEQSLRGAAPTPDAFAAALAAEFADAAPLPGNAFKIELATRTACEILSNLCGSAR